MFVRSVIIKVDILLQTKKSVCVRVVGDCLIVGVCDSYSEFTRIVCVCVYVFFSPSQLRDCDRQKVTTAKITFYFTVDSISVRNCVRTDTKVCATFVAENRSCCQFIESI